MSGLQKSKSAAWKTDPLLTGKDVLLGLPDAPEIRGTQRRVFSGVTVAIVSGRGVISTVESGHRSRFWDARSWDI
ncbi:hypothetical protein NDU88_000781 [Pleurodeles waltl]|uniref:Uncharacterized protein n=1 Tax=Pleurodeles waltl TaxID=8319 RepID=A0AAV7SXP2_PLEWA|nr:hypothetical protein NDU88_000781 [Pleurodeles waltl]